LPPSVCSAAVTPDGAAVQAGEHAAAGAAGAGAAATGGQGPRGEMQAQGLHARQPPRGKSRKGNKCYIVVVNLENPIKFYFTSF
jgi:hypothetical protein